MADLAWEADVLKPWTRYFLYIPSLPSDLLALLWGALVRVLWGESLRWDDGALVVTLRKDSWPARTWYAQWGGTTLSHGIMINGADAARTRILFHEHVHVKQFEGSALCALVMAAGFASSHAYLPALVLWIALPWFLYGASMLVAVLRGENAYRHNAEEEAAYDATDEHGPR